jgi:hypothetical protein
MAPTAPIQFDPNVTREVPADNEAALKSKNTHCRVTLHAIADARENKDGFGTEPEYRLFADNIPTWLESGLTYLLNENYAADTSTGSKVALDVTIQRAYVHHVSTARNANLVLSVKLVAGNRPVESKFYRGSDSGTNWAGNASEVEAAMNRALLSAFRAMSPDIDRLCAAPAAS